MKNTPRHIKGVSAWRLMALIIPALAVAVAMAPGDSMAARSRNLAPPIPLEKGAAPLVEETPVEMPLVPEAPAGKKEPSDPVIFQVLPEGGPGEGVDGAEPVAGEAAEEAPVAGDGEKAAAPEAVEKKAEEAANAPSALPARLQKIISQRKAAQAAASQTRQAAAGTVVLNFNEANLREILQTISEITGENFILAPGVNAKVSIKTMKPVAKADVFGIFETILDLNGLAPVKTGSYYKIVPSQAAKQHNIAISRTADPNKVPGGDTIINLLVPIEFISANEVSQVIKPMISTNGSISVYPRTNTLMVTDISTNLKKVLEVMELLDVDTFKALNIELVPVRRVDALTLSNELNDIFTNLGFSKDTTRLIVTPLERLNSVIVIASSSSLLDSAKEWIDRLDQLPSIEGTSIHTYYVQNDTASNLKNLLEQLYGGRSGAAVQGNAPAAAAAAKQAAKPGGPAQDGNEEIKIYIYEPSNALIVRSSQRDYMSILNTLKELDKPPKQVLIEAMIVEVSLDESTKYGIQWSALTGNFNVQQNTQMVGSKIDSPEKVISTPIGITAPTGLAAFLTDGSRFFGILQALASDGKVKVLSNPHIMVKNYEKASINIGSDEPVATQSTQTAVTGTAGLIQNIEYRKTGVLLTVTTQITEGGMIALTVRQEVSNKSTDRTVGNAVYPSFSKREAETSVVSKDGETILIGGLIDENKDVTKSGVPLLKDIPILGSLFRFTNITESRTELAILLTAKVIANPEAAASVSDEFKKKVKDASDLLKKGALN